MSIPLDRLYHYIESVAQEVYGDTVIYRFWPHGSKKIEDLTPVNSYQEIELLTQPQIFCNDQEPLNFELYQNYTHYKVPDTVHNELSRTMFRQNLRKNIFNVFDKCVLVHSEKNSPDLLKYVNHGFVPVYYWSHAVIALDWFRYAKYIKKEPSTPTVDFLAYNRAWTGTREYRLKFADLLIDHNITNHCKTSIKFHDNQQHYSNHSYQNITWKPTNNLETYFTENTTSSCYSADFDLSDYQDTHCEVVLETLFDTPRLHLTEKTLRPIALGHPFLLCAPKGSLQYLRSYGFKTFETVINEDYDLISDPRARLDAVVNLMKTISMWTPSERQEKFAQMQQIANFNKNHFFSTNFFNLIISELTANLKTAVEIVVKSSTFDRCIDLNQCLADHQKYLDWQRTYIETDCIDANLHAYNTALNLKKSFNKY